VSNTVTALEVWLLACMLLVFLTLMEYAVILRKIVLFRRYAVFLLPYSPKYVVFLLDLFHRYIVFPKNVVLPQVCRDCRKPAGVCEI
jgi:hypothetical protein